MLKTITLGYVALLSTVVTLANTRSLSPLVRHLHDLPGGDKWCHFFLFGGLSFLLTMTLAAGKPRRRREIVGWTIVGLIILTSLEEYSQSLFAHRHFDRLDILSNIAGTSLFGVSTLLLPVTTKWKASPAVTHEI